MALFGTVVMPAAAGIQVSAWLFTMTEHWRMAEQISSGKLRGSRSRLLKPKFCQLSLKELNLAVNRMDSFVGIVGVKSSGKTSTLQLFADDPANSNVMYITMTLGEKVSDALYKTLHGSVYKLSKCFDILRPTRYSDPKYVITNVFKMVQNKTGKPVIAVIDLQPPTTRSVSETQNIPFDPIARSFVRGVKFLVADCHMMKCLFASCEGAGFLVEKIREPRLRLFTMSELPLCTAEEYLKDHNISLDPEIHELLSFTPLDFTNLAIFALNGMATKKRQ